MAKQSKNSEMFDKTLGQYLGHMSNPQQVQAIPAQIEHFLGQMEDENSDGADMLDDMLLEFMERSATMASAHDILPPFAKGNEEGLKAALYDNYAHFALAAIKHGDRKTKAPLIAWAAFNKHSYQGWKDEVAIVRSLALAGFDPNLPDASSQTPLHLMSFMKVFPNSSPRAVRVLLKKGADANARNRNGDTPLTYLCAAEGITDRMYETAVMLLEAGADPLAKSNDGATPYSLLLQCQQKNPDGRRGMLIDMIEDAAGIVPPFGEKRQDGVISAFVTKLKTLDPKAAAALMSDLTDEDGVRKTMRESMHGISRVITSGMETEDDDEFMEEAAPVAGMIAMKDPFHLLLMQFCLNMAASQCPDEGTAVGKDEFVERMQLILRAAETVRKKLSA